MGRRVSSRSQETVTAQRREERSSAWKGDLTERPQAEGDRRRRNRQQESEERSGRRDRMDQPLRALRSRPSLRR